MAHFNGIVESAEGPIKVVNGVAQAGGETFFVSDDGSLVVNGNRQIVAVIVDNKVQELTPEIIDQLQSSGMVESKE